MQSQQYSQSLSNVTPQDFLNNRDMMHNAKDVHSMKFSKSSLAFIFPKSVLVVEANTLYAINEFIIELIHNDFYGVTVYLEKLTIEQLIRVLYIDNKIISNDIKLQTVDKFEYENPTNVKYKIQIKLTLNQLDLN